MPKCASGVLLLTAVCALAQTKTPPGEVAKPGGKVVNYEPITARERLNWFAWETFGPASLGGGLFSAGFGTAFNQPHEYGTHWAGFGERYGMRLTGISTSNAMEASIGALWGEDPRYFRAPDETFHERIIHVLKWSFVAVDRNGHTMPAYARYIAVTGSNFLSNTWREPSEANTGHALERTALGFTAHIVGNAFDEFWPDVKTRVFHRGPAPAAADH